MCNPFNSDEVTAYKAHNNKVLATSPCLTFNNVTHVQQNSQVLNAQIEPNRTFIMPPPFEEWWRGIKYYPCPCVRPSVIKIWCPLNNFWKTASIWFIFGMLMYNIKTQVKFDLGYNPLIFDRVMGLLHLAGASVSYGHISSFILWSPPPLIFVIMRVDKIWTRLINFFQIILEFY